MPRIQSHEDLIVWQKAMDLATETYRLSKAMPKVEEFRLTGQLLRAATSVPTNIAEGHSRDLRKDYARFIAIARGSLAETQTLLQLAIRVDLIKSDHALAALSLCREIGRMLNSLLVRLREPVARSTLTPDT